MNKFLTKNKFNIISGMVAFGTSAIVKQLIDHSFEKQTGNEPPKNPSDKNYRLGQVLLYSALTALTGAAVKVLVRHFSTEQWKEMGGEVPERVS